jgi:hypothetical protein
MLRITSLLLTHAGDQADCMLLLRMCLGSAAPRKKEKNGLGNA